MGLEQFPMKIAFIGAHRTGKTTLCLGLAEWISRNGYHVDTVKEVAANCKLQINEGTTEGAQQHILHQQIADELYSTERYDITVCDRSAVDNNEYYERKFGRNPLREFIMEHWIRTYNMLIYVPVHFEANPTNISDADPNFIRDIDNRLVKTLEEEDIHHYKLTPDGNFLVQSKEIIRNTLDLKLTPN
jgi:hypothetical protein